MHTRGLLQSLLSEHPDARPTPDDLDEQPGIAQAMATATDTTAKTQAKRRRRMDIGTPYGSGPTVAHVLAGESDGLMIALGPILGHAELTRIQPTPPPPAAYAFELAASPFNPLPPSIIAPAPPVPPVPSPATTEPGAPGAGTPELGLPTLPATLAFPPPPPFAVRMPSMITVGASRRIPPPAEPPRVPMTPPPTLIEPAFRIVRLRPAEICKAPPLPADTVP
jgi:hypothetical protein